MRKLFPCRDRAVDLGMKGCLKAILRFMVPGARHGPNVYPFDSSGWRLRSAQV